MYAGIGSSGFSNEHLLNSSREKRKTIPPIEKKRN
jgi:hypothetical protein